MFSEGPFLRREDRWEGSSLRCKVRRAHSSSQPSCASRPAPGRMGVHIQRFRVGTMVDTVCHTSSKAGASAVDEEAPEKEEPTPEHSPTDNASRRHLCKPSGGVCKLPRTLWPSLLLAWETNRPSPDDLTDSVFFTLSSGPHIFFSPQSLLRRLGA